MKNFQPIAIQEPMVNRINLAVQHKKAQKQKLNNGSVMDRYPVILDGGRTIIYITDRSKEGEIRERYERDSRM